MPLIGFKPTTTPTASLAATTRQYTSAIATAGAYGNTISFIHLVAAGDKIVKFGFYSRATTEGVAATLSCAAYLTNATGTTQTTRIGSAGTITTSSATAIYNEIVVDIDLSAYVGQYIKVAGGYGNNARIYYTTCTSGDSVSVDANAPSPFGSSIARTSMLPIYMEISTAQKVLNVNNGAGLVAGSTGNTALTEGFATDPVSGTVGPLSLINFSFNSTTKVATFSVPAYADAAVWPALSGTASVNISNGTISAALAGVPTIVPAGWSQVTFAFPIEDDQTFLGSRVSLTNKEAAYPTSVSGVTISLSTTGGFTATGAVVFTMYLRDLTSGELTQLNVTLNEAGAVVEVKRIQKTIVNAIQKTIQKTI